MLARLPARAVPWGTNGEDAVSYRIRVASARKLYKYASTAKNFPRPPELCAPDQWPHLTILAFIVLDEFTLEASSAFIFFLDVHLLWFDLQDHFSYESVSELLETLFRRLFVLNGLFPQ